MGIQRCKGYVCPNNPLPRSKHEILFLDPALCFGANLNNAGLRLKSHFMQKPLWISERWMQWVMRLLISGLITLAVAITVFIVDSYHQEHITKVANLGLRGAKTKIIQPDHPDSK